MPSNGTETEEGLAAQLGQNVRHACRRWGATLAILVPALSAPGHAAAGEYARPEAGFTFGNPAFCAPQKPIRDFGLSRLRPRVRDFPAEGDLPFGPKAVRLSSLNYGRVIPTGRGFGYGLRSEDPSGRTQLHWTLRVRMITVDRRGRRGQVVDRRVVEVKSIANGAGVNLRLHPLSRSGFYLYRIDFATSDGRTLGRYGAYLKVFAQAHWRARLGLSKRDATRGQQVLSRVENLGTAIVAFGEAFYVQRLERGGWVRVPDATQVGWLKWLGEALPGRSGRCSRWLIPSDFPLGQYRIVREAGSRSWLSGDRSYFLTAPISVLDTTDFVVADGE